MIKKFLLNGLVLLICYGLLISDLSPYLVVVSLGISMLLVELAMKSNALVSDVVNDKQDKLTELLFSQSPSMIAKIDTNNWNILAINETLALTLNLAHAYQIIGRSVSELFSENEQKKLDKAIRTLQRKGVLHQLSSELVTIDNKKVQVTIDCVFPGDNSQSNVAYFYITNISSIKKIEGKLQASKNLLQSIIDNMLEAVIITNAKGKIIDWNPQAAKLTGQSKNNALNQSISQLIQDDKAAPLTLEKDINNYLSNKDVNYIGKRKRLKILNNVNQSLPVELCSFPVISDEGEYSFCFFLHDITKELKAREQEIRLSTIVKQTQDAIISLDADNNVSSWNNSATKIFGYTETDTLNKSIFKFLTKSHQKLLSAKLETMSKSSDHLQYEFSVNTNSDECQYFMANINMIQYTRDSLGVSMIVRDIGQLKRNEAMIRDLMEELKASNQELQSFAYIASHDLKEPLRGIKNYAMILKDDYAQILDESGLEYLNLLITSCSRLELLLESLLHYSKVGNLDLSFQNIDTANVISEVKNSIHHMLNQKNAIVVVDETLPRVSADESRLSEVITNLITNGLKYNDKLKPIITIGSVPSKSTDDHVCLYVKDNGIGIEGSKIDSVFEIFQRLHKKDQFGGGAGAGLTITKRIIERHQGQIWLDSEPGIGTTFYFTLKKGSTHESIQDSLGGGAELLFKTKNDD